MSKATWCPPLGKLGAAAAVLVTLGAGVARAAPTPPEGLWFTDEKESVIRVQPCGDDAQTYCGTIAWLKKPNDAEGAPKLDKNNPDPDKAKHTLLGLQILQNLSADDDHWTGKAYNPEDGKTYDVTFKVVRDDGPEHADLRGCVLRYLCRTKSLARAKAIPGEVSGEADATHGHKHKANKKASGTP